jgi:hypothetical protein
MQPLSSLDFDLGASHFMYAKLCFSLVTTLALQPASSQTWEIVGASKSDIFMIDEASLKQDDSGGRHKNRKMWTNSLSLTPKKRLRNSDVHHTVVLYSFDCKNDTFKSLAYTEYNKDGKVLYSNHELNETQHVIPRTAGATFFLVACNEKERAETLAFWNPKKREQ